MTNEQMQVELPELPKPDKNEQDMDVNLGRVEYRYFCEDAMREYATAAILADRERRAAQAEPSQPWHPQYVAGFKDGHKMGRERGRADANKKAAQQAEPRDPVEIASSHGTLMGEDTKGEMPYYAFRIENGELDAFAHACARELSTPSAAEPVMLNGLTEAQTSATESVAGVDSQTPASTGVVSQKPVEVDNNPWLPHNGGPCPVAPDVLVHVRFRHGGMLKAEAFPLRWDHRNSFGDIIEYRLHREEIQS